MVEKKLVVDHLKIDYKGLFSMQDFYRTLDSFFKEKGWDKRETRNSEFVSPEGKYVEMEIEPFKKITDYAKLVIRINIIIKNLKEVVVEKQKHKMKMNQGDVQVIIDGFLITDYENRWEGKPEYVFIRALFDKFVYKRYNSEFERTLVNEVEELTTTLKSFLNLYRF
ncbi:hypothetical protein J4439_07430 [Candidatus Woesearchaeota archaeon]|nr:hypothetical protein [Candidatus Woesearchaeota archaeon]